MKKEKDAGIVYLVGSGPGHPDLITRMGWDALQNCDAVVYDDLAAFELVAALPERIKRYYVGKRAGAHYKPQDATSKLIVEIAERGLNVVRLKGGDPLIFGRGGEEITFLKNTGIEYKIIPGVTALSAVGAGAGIPLTDRRDASWVLLATGHEAVSGSPPVPWHEIARLKSGTVAIYMGVGDLPRIVEDLTKGGIDPKTKAAIIQSGYTGSQKIVNAQIDRLEKACSDAGIKAPAIILIGNVTEYSKELNWWKEGKLAGKRVLVTRPYKVSQEFCQVLRLHGAEPLPLPTIQIEPYTDDDGWRNVESALNKSGWLVFTSRPGVEYFIEGLWRRGYDNRCLYSFKIAAIGPGTSKALTERGLRPDLVPDVSLGSELARELARRIDNPQNTTVIRVRGDLSDDVIDNTVTELDAELVQVTVYQTVTPSWEPHWIKVVKENPPDYITFTSGSTVQGFVKILGSDDAVRVASESKVISIGPSTTAVARELGIKVDAEAKKYNMDGMIEVFLNNVNLK
ncbi:uroporphyrinogen-III C-methyltransferase [bacterium]|nr:uroporphyrinogen-III C-methyltransferase [bacterium]